MKILTIYIALTLLFAILPPELLCDNDDRVPPYSVNVSGDVNLGVFVQNWTSQVYPPDNSITFYIKLNRKKSVDIMLDNSMSITGNTGDVKITTEWTVNNGSSIEQFSSHKRYRLTNMIMVTVTITQIQVSRTAESGPRSFEQELDIEYCF